jgi:hypothetical protein
LIPPYLRGEQKGGYQGRTGEFNIPSPLVGEGKGEGVSGYFGSKYHILTIDIFRIDG